MAGPRARGGRGVLAFRTNGETRRNARGGGGGEGRRVFGVAAEEICVRSHFLPSLVRRITFADQPSSGRVMGPPGWRPPTDAARTRPRGASLRGARGPVAARAARARAFPFPASASRASRRDEGTRARGVRVSRLPRRVARVRLARRSIVQVANDDGSFVGVSPRRRRDPVSSPPRGFPVSGFRALDRRRARGVRPPIPLRVRARPTRAGPRSGARVETRPRALRGKKRLGGCCGSRGGIAGAALAEEVPSA